MMRARVMGPMPKKDSRDRYMREEEVMSAISRSFLFARHVIVCGVWAGRLQVCVCGLCI